MNILEGKSFELINGDCLREMANLPENSIDSIVCDPPYGLGFMGKDWDRGVPGKDFWKEALRVAKPGAYLLAFGGTRTYHRLACAIEDAGWEIRDTMGWLYGSGFPKSLNVSKAIDKEAGEEREVIGVGAVCCEYLERGEACRGHGDEGRSQSGATVHSPTTAPATTAAKQWNGWGTALKPSWEPIIVARKPLSEDTVAQNVIKHGTGAINIDGCRIGNEIVGWGGAPSNGFSGGLDNTEAPRPVAGRWPANIMHDGSEDVVRLFPDTGKSTGGRTVKRSGGGNVASGKASEVEWSSDDPGYGDSGSAARFFYCPKASRRDRDEGCERLPLSAWPTMGSGIGGQPDQQKPNNRNNHPTVKPTALIRYLCRLVTQPNGVVLDPFMGSGSTGKAALLEGFRFIGIEINPEYMEIARKRVSQAEVSVKDKNQGSA